MNKDSNTLLICLAVVSMSLFAVNVYADFPLDRFTGYIMISAGFLFLVTIISLIIYLFRRSRGFYKWLMAVLMIFLLLNIPLTARVVEMEIHKHELAAIEKINTCEKAKELFDEDLKNASLKYFIFGMAVDEDWQEYLEEHHDLEVYYLGCIVSSSLECYNDLVTDYLNLEEQYPAINSK